MMILKALITLAILVYGLLVPILEINTSHVFNPSWPAHALLHEVWQLITNSMLALYCLWLTWVKKDLILPSLIGMLVTGGFLLAFLIKGSFGGSMVHPDGSEATLMGMNAGVLVFALVFAVFAWAALSVYKKYPASLKST
jgi:hypothetical protein